MKLCSTLIQPQMRTNKKYRSLFFWIITLGLFLSFPASLFAQDQAPQTNILTLSKEEKTFLKNHPLIRIGNETDWPPFDYFEFGKPKGLAIDHVKLLAKKLGLKVEFVNGFTWTELLELTKQKKIDVLPGLYRNIEREGYLNYTSPYYNGKLGIFSNKDVTSFQKGKNWKGVQVGIQTQHGSIPIVKKLMPGIILVEIDSPAQLVQSLATNKLSGIIGNPLLFYYYAKENQVTNLNLVGYVDLNKKEQLMTSLHIGVRKDWPILQQLLQKSMNAVTSEEMQKLESQWTGFQSTTKLLKKIPLTSQEKAFLKHHPIIRVSNEKDYPPFDFTIGDQPQGYSIDLLNLAAERIGIQVEYVNGYSWAQLVELFKSGKLDLLHTLNDTPERRKYGLFSEPFFWYKNYFIIREGDPEIDSIKELYGKKVAVGKSWSQEEYIRSNHPEVQLVVVNNINSMLDAVSTGRADALIGEEPVVRYFLKKRGTSDLKLSGWSKGFDKGQNRKLHFMAHKKNPELISMLNKALTSLTPRELEELKLKWLASEDYRESSSPKFIHLTSKEKKYLAENTPLKICVSSNQLPYEQISSTGKHEGIIADYFGLLLSRLNIKAETYPTKSWAESIKAAKLGRCHLISSTNTRMQPNKSLLVTTPYVSFPYVIATTNDKLFIDDLKDELQNTFVAVAGGAVIEALKKQYPTIKITEVLTIHDGLQLLREGKAFGFIETPLAIGYTLQKESILDLKIAGKISGTLNLRIATSDDEPQLQAIFQKAIDSLTKEDKQKVFSHWISVKFEQRIDYTLVIQIFAVALLLFLGMLYWNRKLVAARGQTQKAMASLRTAQVQLQQKNSELIVANDVKNKFFSIIAHDLRGPIGSLSVLFENVIQTKDDLSDDILVALRQSTQKTSQLLENLLTWSKTQQGDISFAPASLDLHEIFAESSDLLAQTAQQKNIQLQVHCPPDLFVMCDRNMILTIIRNLVNNAIKFTHEGGNVQIDTEVLGEDVQISITDNGTGMKDTVREKLFQNGNKGISMAGTNRETGTGLGLTLCHEFIKKHGRTIEVESNLNEGSRFWFTLPKATKPLSTEPIVDFDMSHLQGLIVDDEALHRETTANALGMLSIAFDFATNGKEALEMSKLKDYSFILMDIDMPVMDGIDAARLIQEETNSEQMIIALSSYEQKDLESRRDDVAFAAYLQKPLERQKLIVVLLDIML